MKIDIDPADLQPVILAAVEATVARLSATRINESERLAYPEIEAAGLLGIRKNTLRDARLRGEIPGSLVGKKIVYRREDLLAFLLNQRVRK